MLDLALTLPSQIFLSAFPKTCAFAACKDGRVAAAMFFEGFDSLEGVVFDSACKHCWKDGGLKNNDSSSSSESTDASLA